MALISFRQASHRFSEGRFGIRDMSFDIEAGQCIVIAGENGAGKTVLMKHMNGLLLPTEGETLFRGLPIREQRRNIKKAVGLVFQDPELQIVCPTVREELSFGPENLGLKRAEIEKRIAKSADLLGMNDLLDKRTSVLSGGEKRKIAVASVLAMEPEIIILDEPFIGLDYRAIKDVLGCLIKLHAAGHTMIVVSHEIEKVLAHADRLMIISAGRLAEDDHPGRLLPELERYGLKNPLGAYSGLEDLTWLK